MFRLLDFWASGLGFRVWALPFRARASVDTTFQNYTGANC